MSYVLKKRVYKPSARLDLVVRRALCTATNMIAMFGCSKHAPLFGGSGC
jgi:hypothetical protein